MSGETQYTVGLTAPAALSIDELKVCVDIISDGQKVNVTDTKLLAASHMAVARKAGVIVGAGVIKGSERTGYNAKVSKRSGFALPAIISELGYIAVAPEHQGNKLSSEIVDLLLHLVATPVFATTSTKEMKGLLGRRGFVHKGTEWEGSDGELLSLWFKE